MPTPSPNSSPAGTHVLSGCSPRLTSDMATIMNGPVAQRSVIGNRVHPLSGMSGLFTTRARPGPPYGPC
jgi:hypothetical protein